MMGLQQLQQGVTAVNTLQQVLSVLALLVQEYKY
jgi:hypothetical protein